MNETDAFVEEVRKRQRQNLELLDARQERRLKASALIAVLAWMLFMTVTFLVALGEVEFGSRQHVYSSMIFLLVGVIAGLLSWDRPATAAPASRSNSR